jgi:hypothetical protein
MLPWPRPPRPRAQGAPGAVVIRVPARAQVAAAVALLACLCAIVHSTSVLAATPLPRESLVTFEGQLNGHQVSAVTLHTKTHTFHASLTDGRRVGIAFPTSQQQRLEGDIRARGLAVQVAKVPSPPSHKRRYIAAAVVIVVVILAILGLLLLSVRRRRVREDEQGPGYR